MQKTNPVIVAATHGSGIVNVIAGICVGLAYVLHPHHATPEVVMSSYWFWVHILFVFSLIGGVLGVVGIFAYHSENSSWVGLIGMVLVIVSLMLIFGLNFWEVFINPVVAREVPDFVEKYGAGEVIGLVKVVFPLAGALFVAGYISLCIDLIRGKTLSAGACWLTIVGVLIFGAGLSGFFPMIVVQFGSVIFALGLVSLGMSLWNRQS